MATYTHFEVTPPQIDMFTSPKTWLAAMGSLYSATATTITIANNDGTWTVAHGSFLILNNSLLAGVVNSLDRTSSDGSIVYEKIAGTAIDALQFVATTAEGKLGLALAGADTMFGYSGNDLLNGYGGADQMAGGGGDDTYVVDSANDVVTELLGQGRDLVKTTLTNYTLTANVEILLFSDAGSHNGFGNSLDNGLVGNTGHDVLYGLGGNDSLDDGGGGDDTLIGGTGNDLYRVHSAGDTVVEQANQGIDTIQTTLTNYTLLANFENLYLDIPDVGFAKGNSADNRIAVNGGSGITMYGYGGDDTLMSSGGSDTMIGGSGNDRLFASSGEDTLTGGTDDDTFIISIGNHVITDFTPGLGVHDRIDLKSFKPGTIDFGQNIFRDLADVLAHTTQNGADAYINLGENNSLILKNVQKSALIADDFVWSLTPKDFKGDTVSDILWRNDGGSVSVWENGQIGGAHVVGSGVDATWHVAGTGDFDGDARNDILWRNDDGVVSIWDKGAIDQAHVVSGAINIPASWHIAGVGDFEGDDQSDILWRNDNGAVSVWKDGSIEGAKVIAGAGSIPDSWHIVGTGDFDSNGRDDILWRNDNGTLSIWDNGQKDKAHVIVPAGVIGNDWQIAGTGDFDGNGYSDILWHNDNGAASIWDDGQIGGAHIIAAAGVVPNSWHIAGVGDYDGNRQSDILWRNDNGTVSVWDNGQMAGAHVVGTGVDASWHIM